MVDDPAPSVTEVQAGRAAADNVQWQLHELTSERDARKARASDAQTRLVETQRELTRVKMEMGQIQTLVSDLAISPQQQHWALAAEARAIKEDVDGFSGCIHQMWRDDVNLEVQLSAHIADATKHAPAPPPQTAPSRRTSLGGLADRAGGQPRRAPAAPAAAAAPGMEAPVENSSFRARSPVAPGSTLTQSQCAVGGGPIASTTPVKESDRARVPGPP